MTTLTLSKANQRGPAQGAGGRPEGGRHGRGRGEAGRGLPGHRRPAEGLRRVAGGGHPARRVGHRRDGGRPGPARLPAGLRDPVPTASCSPAFDQIVSQLAKMRMRSQGRAAVPVTIRIRSAAASGRWSTTASHPRRCLRTRRGCGWSPAPARPTPTTMIQQSIHCDDPVIFFEPKRRYWDKAEVDTVAGLAGALPLEAARTVAEGNRRDRAHVRADGQDLHGGRGGGPRRRPRAGSDRPALAVAARPGHHLRVGPPDRALRGRARGPGHRGIGAEIAARVTEACFYQLEAPVLRVGGFSTPYPPSRLEDHYRRTWTGCWTPPTARSRTEMARGCLR